MTFEQLPHSLVGGAVADGDDESPNCVGSDYAVLSRQIRAVGLLERRPVAYACRVFVTLGFYALVWAVIFIVGNSWLQIISGAALGVAFTQVAFLSHDAGHQQIFDSRRANDIFGQVSGNLLIGLSFGWWVDKHNRHHANPNKEDFDPDIGDGALVFTTSQVAARTGRFGRTLARSQAWLFFPLLTFEGWNLRFASLVALRRGSRRSHRGGSRMTEAALLCMNGSLYVTALLLAMSPVTALVFVVVHQGVWGFYMGCSFAPNHKGMPIIGADEDVDFLRRQVLTSRNVRGGWFTDLLLGGLNYQIEHHLFPSMPRASLRHARYVVREHCSQLGIAYCETSLIGSYTAAISYLNQLSNPPRAARS